MARTHFRDGERRVIARLLQEGPMVLATGGGAFMNEETRDRIARQGISVWLRADLEVLMRRVRKRATGRSSRPRIRRARCGISSTFATRSMRWRI